ncbi:hypothetical protein AB0M20_38275 [Actinoplanes sp. NPDC051633]|uniref:hypothetical protein n=1 Tax=Actinoplanes sp. NPDC051633 TaxID=3155670 RepID=UPI003431C235
MRDVWERAVAHLVTVVVERTGAESGWYIHCRQVLGWFLSAAGIPEDRHADLIGSATGGVFSSWAEPGDQVIGEIAGRLADTVLRHDD